MASSRTAPARTGTYTDPMRSQCASVRVVLTLLVTLLAGGVTGGAAAARPDETAARPSVSIQLQWDGYAERAELLATTEGPRYRLSRTDGSAETLTPEEFARRSIEIDGQRSVFERALNVHGPVGIAWVLFGLLGQAIFMGRMVVQWLVSEKSKRSIVPPTFWFLSLVGSLMLLTYFVWRWDIVGMLGQSLGTVIYVRNIMLIRHHKRVSELEAEAAPA